MNRILQFLIFMFWGTLLYSQNVVVDGVTFSADGKTLIKYPQDKVDEEYIVPEGTEIICKKAFCSNYFLKAITLPFNLKEIGNNAFVDCFYLTSVTWGRFPLIIGRDIFYKSPVQEFYVSDGANCAVIDNVLFSKDKKKLLRYPPERKLTESHYEHPNVERIAEYMVPEGTEIIGELAFERANLYDVGLPSTLKKIEEGAFWVEARIPVRNSKLIEYDSEFDWDLQYRGMNEVICNAIVPPEIIGQPFTETYWTELYVPEESFDVYCYASGWTKFRNINGKINLVSKQNVPVKTSKVWFEDFVLNVVSEHYIERIDIYNQMGFLLVKQIVAGNSSFCDMKKSYLSGILVLRIIYDDNSEDIFKLCK